MAKFGAVYCVYDDDDYLAVSLEAIYPAVDRVLFLMSDVPWNGATGDNRATVGRVERLVEANPNARLVRGHWTNEMDQRNAGLDMLLAEGIDYCVIIDADEIYHTKDFTKMLYVASQLPQFAAFHVEWNTYWTKEYYRIEPREPYKPVVIVSTKHFFFTEIRTGTTSVTRTLDGTTKTPSTEEYSAAFIPPHICICYHLSYCRDDAMMRRKLETNSHSKNFIPNWYRDVWERWTPEMENLHPVHPEWYKCAVQEDIEQLPDALRRHIAQTGTRGSSPTRRAEP